MNKKVLLEALETVYTNHWTLSISPELEGKVLCICGAICEEIVTHIAEKQIEALIPLIGQGIAEAIEKECDTYCIWCGQEYPCGYSKMAQIARDWKAVQGE